MMEKVFLAIMFCLVSYAEAFSQTEDSKKAVFQLSFVTPLSTNGLHSFQYTNKASFNILIGTSKNEEAFTLGGISNIIMNDAEGVLFAGLSNYVGNDGKGVQFAGLVNVNKNSFNGLQFAGLINIAKNVNGVQFAGLINIAENSDCPIGLINIIKNGEKSIAVTYDAAGSTVISFRSGGRYTYGIIGVGYNHKIKDNSLVTEGGLGAHIPVVSWASMNYMTTSNMRNSNLFADKSVWNKYTDARLERLYIGYQIGVQYIF